MKGIRDIYMAIKAICEDKAARNVLPALATTLEIRTAVEGLTEGDCRRYVEALRKAGAIETHQGLNYVMCRIRGGNL